MPYSLIFNVEKLNFVQWSILIIINTCLVLDKQGVPWTDGLRDLGVNFICSNNFVVDVT